MSERRTALLAALAYALLVLCMAGPFLFTSGMAYETAFPYMSETASSIWRGFLYEADPLRVYTSFFYHLAYLSAEAAGVPGSFVPYQIVYAMLWGAGGLLLFLLLRRLFPSQVLLCYTIGALLLTHASDTALLWVGQMNHMGFIFWMLLAGYCFIVAAQATRPAFVALFGFLACLFAYMSLWSYESQIFIILAFPIFFLLLNRPVTTRLRILTAAWYVVPAVYICWSVVKYMRTFAGSYQHSVMRSSWSVPALIGDLLYNVGWSLGVGVWYLQPGDMAAWRVVLLSVCATAVFAAGAALLSRGRKDPLLHDASTARKMLVAGSILLVLSFPVYLLLANPRSLWRTQFLSGIGAAMVIGGIVAMAAARLPRKLGGAAFFGITALIVSYGSFCAIQDGAIHRKGWSYHREVMAAVIRAVPQVKPGTMFVLTNVSRARDPFDANDWFESALRLAYPGTPASGVYYYGDQQPARNLNQRLESNQWHWDGTPLVPVVQNAKLEDTLILQYRDGAVKIVPEIPPFVCAKGCDSRLYHPQERILGGAPSPRAVNRYGPL